MVKNRTNIRIIPSQDTITKMCHLLNLYDLPHQDFLSNPHCTIVYSYDVIDVQHINFPIFKFPIVGKNAHFSFFDTSEDGIVLVVEFENNKISDCFYYLKDRYNLTTRYSEYKAHITIQKNMADQNISLLPKIDFELLFDKIEMDNGS